MAFRAFGFRARFLTSALSLFLLLASSRALAGGGTFLGPTPYLSKADSPFLAQLNAGQMYLDDFECGVLSVPGVTPSDGTVIPPGFEGFIDSVDADDGAIDGSGLAGHSLFTGNGATGITFTFNPTTLGAFPTQVGIVWTDGGGDATFEAFDSIGASLGTIGPIAIGDGSNSGTTAEDRFFGVTFAGGISAIKLSNTSGGLEVDHLQYGLYTVGGADLSLTKTDTPDPVSPGGTLTYTLTVSNGGPLAACLATVTDPLPPGTTLVSCITSQGSCSGPPVGTNGTVTGNLGIIAASGSATMTIAVTAPGAPTTDPLFLSNSATVSTSSDGFPANNTATAGTTVVAGPPATATPTTVPATATATATATPIAGAVVPTLSFPMLALLGLALAGAALVRIRGT
jgi:uncharacterized repeat protein (TIGR01451 family)